MHESPQQSYESIPYVSIRLIEKTNSSARYLAHEYGRPLPIAGVLAEALVRQLGGLEVREEVRDAEDAVVAVTSLQIFQVVVVAAAPAAAGVYGVGGLDGVYRV